MTKIQTVSQCSIGFVQVEFVRRLPMLIIVSEGVGPNRTRPMAERIRSAIEGAGYDFPRTRVVATVSFGVTDSRMVPALPPRATESVELAIAIAILIESGQIDPTLGASSFFAGELPLETGPEILKNTIRIISEA